MDTELRSDLELTVKRVARYLREATQGGDRADKVHAVAELTASLASLLSEFRSLVSISTPAEDSST